LVKLSKIEWKTGIASFLFHILVRQFSRPSKVLYVRLFLVRLVYHQFSVVSLKLDTHVHHITIVHSTNSSRYKTKKSYILSGTYYKITQMLDNLICTVV